MPVSCCSSTWVTLFSTVSADAPGYAAPMLTLGSATSGYCATGSTRIDAMPARITAIVITQAKTGRLAKNLASMSVLLRGGLGFGGLGFGGLGLGGLGVGGLGVGGLGVTARLDLRRMHRHA